MSLRTLIAESETEYKYRIFTTAPVHGGAELAAIRVGLAGRMARDITPGGVIPWMGTKSDRFPDVPMKPVYVVDLVTGLPLSLKNAVRELSFALNVAQDKIIIDGEDKESEGTKEQGAPYQKDGVTPGFLSKDVEAVTPQQSLKDLLGDLSNAKGHVEVRRTGYEIGKLAEGFSVTQIEAELMLNEDLMRGYYAVFPISEGRYEIVGPLTESPANCPLDLDRGGSLTLREMNYESNKYVTVRVQDTDTGKEYPIMVSVSDNIPEDSIRNLAVQQVATKFSIPEERLIAMDPNRNNIPGAMASRSAQSIAA